MNKVQYDLKKLLPIFLISVSFAVSAYGRVPEMRDRDFPNQWMERKGRTYFLNGRGVHTVSILAVKVYEISLYLEKRSQDPEEILKSPGIKIVILKFLRDVDADKLRSALSSGFSENCADRCKELRVYLDQLNSEIPDFHEGSFLEFQVLPGEVILRTSFGTFSEVKSPDFGKVLLSIWLGPSPPSLSLKNQMLGR